MNVVASLRDTSGESQGAAMAVLKQSVRHLRQHQADLLCKEIVNVFDAATQAAQGFQIDPSLAHSMDVLAALVPRVSDAQAGPRSRVLDEA